MFTIVCYAVALLEKVNKQVKEKIKILSTAKVGAWCVLSQLLVSVLFISVPTNTENSKFFIKIS